MFVDGFMFGLGLIAGIASIVVGLLILFGIVEFFMWLGSRKKNE